LVRAHSSGGITSGCTRRRRASVVHMQATVNRGGRVHSSAAGFHDHRVHSSHRRGSKRSVRDAADRGLSGRAAPLVNRTVMPQNHRQA
jgi:hypothetical protein